MMSFMLVSGGGQSPEVAMCLVNDEKREEVKGQGVGSLNIPGAVATVHRLYQVELSLSLRNRWSTAMT
jgi:hypothetical protein